MKHSEKQYLQYGVSNFILKESQFNFNQFVNSLPTSLHLDDKSKEPDLETKLQMLLKGLNLNSQTEEKKQEGDMNNEDERKEAVIEFKQARLVYKDGSEYNGSTDSKTKKRHGYGTLLRRSTNGLSSELVPDFEYKGEFVNDQLADGHATLMIYEDYDDNEPKITFKGNILYLKFEGFGSLSIKGEGDYTGHYKAGKKHGNGRFETYEYIYDGSWQDD